VKKSLLIAASCLAVLGVATACAPVQILNTITPSSSFERDRNISYGELERQKLDIYRAEAPKAGAPVLVFVHGGSWDSGSKDIYKFLAEGFTSEGYDVVVPNYRLWPEVKYPDFVTDTAEAIAFTASKFEGRPLVVMGHSAGGYNSLLSVMKPEFYPGGLEAACRSIAGMVSLAGPTGIVALGSEPFISIFPERMFGDDAPMNNVNGPMPPVFFAHGADDTTVYPQNSQFLAEKIKERGGQADIKIYDGLGHIKIIQVISRHFDGDETVKSDIISFVESLDLSRSNFCQ